MFADSMLETSWAQNTRRSWTTVTSLGLQALVIGSLLLLPLWKSVGLPKARVVSTPVRLGRFAEDALPPASGTHSTAVTQSNFWNGRLMQPSHLPTVVRRGADESSPQPPGGMGTGIGTGFPAGGESGLPESIISGIRPVIPPSPPSIGRAVRTSSMLEGNLIRRVDPTYPPLARSARIQGSVVLSAVISKAGTITNLRVLSGHPMLVPSAIDAVRQWLYRPYLLNSEPVEVETQITVNFRLSGS